MTDHIISYTYSGTLVRWVCSCEKHSSGAWYTSEQEAFKRARRHVPEL